MLAAYEQDPLSLLLVSDDGLARAGVDFRRDAIADRHRPGGGYSLDVIARAPKRFLAGFCARH